MVSGVNYKLFLDTVQAAQRPASAQTPDQKAEQETTVNVDELLEAIRQNPLTFLEIMRRFGIDFDQARPLLDELQKTNKITLKTSDKDGRERFEVVP